MSIFKKKSVLLKVLEEWIKDPDSDLSELLSSIPNNDVKTSAEAEVICKGLEIMLSKLHTSFNKTYEDNIYNLTVLFQHASTQEAASVLNNRGIPLLVDILELITKKQYELKSFGSTDMMMLKMFAYYKNKKGFDKLSALINADFKNDEYLWNVITSIVAEDEDKYKLIIEGLNGKIPNGFLGICYMDMCNSIAIRSVHFKHPFNSSIGFGFIQDIVKNRTPENESYVVSATVSLPFLSKEYQEQLLPSIAAHSSVDVQMEAAWAGIKIGNPGALEKLVDFAMDYRYSSKAVNYLNELGLGSKIPSEATSPDFQALSEMCSWLVHPNEFGAYPDHAEIFDKRDLFWPPTRDKRTIHLIKYTYKGHKEDGSDEIGIGLVGSITFSLFGLEDVLQLKPVEVLAIHCNWELQKENYEDIKSGLELLKQHNPIIA